MQSAAVAQAAIMSEEAGRGVPDDQVRAHTYGLLGALLAAPPSADLLGLVAAAAPGPQAEAEFAAAWRQLAIAAERAVPDTLAEEYQALFIGLGRGEVVPYGSWYMTGFLMDKPLAVLRGDLAALGFERQADVREPEDHAAALCETMGMLVADGRDLGTQRHFFERHIGPWMGTFFRDLRESKSAHFYRAVGQFGEQFTEFESRYLTMKV